MATYSAKFSEIATVIAEMGKSTKHIDEMLDILEKNAEKHLSSWEGGARETYREKKAEWDGAAGQMKQKLLQATTTLQNIGETLDITEKQAQKMWAAQGIKR